MDSILEYTVYFSQEDVQWILSASGSFIFLLKNWHLSNGFKIKAHRLLPWNTQSRTVMWKRETALSFMPIENTKVSKENQRRSGVKAETALPKNRCRWSLYIFRKVITMGRRKAYLLRSRMHSSRLSSKIQRLQKETTRTLKQIKNPKLFFGKSVEMSSYHNWIMLWCSMLLVFMYYWKIRFCSKFVRPHPF